MKVRINLIPQWQERERDAGRRLTIQDVANSTGLAYSTVANLRAGKTQRIDVATLTALCEYFQCQPGEPVPFLIYNGNDNDH